MITGLVQFSSDFSVLALCSICLAIISKLALEGLLFSVGLLLRVSDLA